VAALCRGSTWRRLLAGLSPPRNPTLTPHQARRAGYFFDRSLIDAADALAHATGTPRDDAMLAKYRYAATVFLTPPWPEIYQCDDARHHGLESAIAEYERLHLAYSALGYDVVILPKTSVAARVAFILQRLTRAAD